MPKLNTPLPQPLPKECEKAAKIFRSFVDRSNNGLDGVIPREVLQNAKGFAIFTVVKAGFVFSARAGSGIVIARLDDGSWSAPSAIGTAGLGFGGQLGAEVTDFLVVLNSASAVRSFMAAGSVTLGGNASIAVGPLGRNGEATGAVNTRGKVATMYSYSKTKGLFGGISIEGSVLVERQDANVQAYGSDSVSVKLLLGGHIDPPSWAMGLIKTLEECTGAPSKNWIDDAHASAAMSYPFNGTGSPSTGPMRKLKKGDKSPFPPPSWGSQKDSGGYFDDYTIPPPPPEDSSWQKGDTSAAAGFGTKFESEFTPTEELRKHKRFSYSVSQPSTNPFGGSDSNSAGHQRSISLATPVSRSSSISSSSNPFRESAKGIDSFDSTTSEHHKPFIAPKPELTKPLLGGVARAIALYDFQGTEPGDLSFKKGDVIVITEKSDSTDDWWTGKVANSKGIFPANFVEVVN